MTLGEKIQKLRQEQNISQKELAVKLNVSTADVAVWESDEAVLSIADVVKLSSALNITTDDLIIDSDTLEVELIDESNHKETVEEHRYGEGKIKKDASKKKVLVFTALIVIFVAIVGIFAYKLLLPFSKNTKKIEKATSSVVKIYCYDYEGNESATGSGFIAFDDQTVITNYHVMQEAYTCKVSTDEDKTYEVEGILEYSKEQDLVIIKLKENTNLKVLELGESEKIKKGETVTAIGSPLGIKNTVSQGVLSGRLMEQNMDVLQFTAAISSGSSGGALFDEKGKVIGVTYASYIDGQNLNLAIPAECVKDLYNSRGSYAMKTSLLHLIEYPYVEYLEKHPDVPIVKFDELKRSPQAYRDKVVALDAYISSFNCEKTWASYAYSNKENISGDHDYDDSLKSASGITIPYEKVPVMISFTLFKQRWKHVDGDVEVGDHVIIIGAFRYERVGEVDEYGIVSKRELGYMDIELIYKK